MQARRLLLLPLTVILFNIASCGQQNVNGNTKKPMYTNELIHETSPYLLQHAHNPVNWYPWGDKALDKAKKENKMLLISVGYAACHWCHVMEHECYEDTMVANLMNKNFVCIKVDREERPDVDQVYMNAAYLINGNGGWPLNALAMPDGKPFFAGTYFPKKDWMHVLEYFSGLYETDRQKLAEQANNVSQGIKDIENVPLNTSAVSYSINTLNNLYDSFKNSADLQQGGTLGNIKFPMPCLWEYLLQYNYLSSNKDALKSVESTLDNMAKGGIYDQIGGGFARYSTDAKWHAPHFEKMLYDNAQLISLYSHAYQVTANPLYKQIVYETIAFVQRELTSAEGGFYSSLDADSEGEEGRFYVWSDSELKAILGNDAALFSDYFGITANGNWESGKNIPDINYGNKNIEAKYHLTQDQLLQKINTLKKVVLAARNKRVRPHTDDKILTAWNALMVKGLVDAYQAFGEESFLNLAKTNIDFLLKNMMQKDGSLFRNYKNHQANIPAFLDDYAFTISALTNYYQVSFDINYLHKADALIQYVQQHFYDKTSGMFFYTDDLHSNLIARKMEVGDNVIPSSNSEMAKNFLKLGLYFDNKDYSNTAAQLIKNIEGTIGKNLQYYGNWAQAIALQVKAPYEIAIAGNDWQKKLASFQTHYLPNAVFLGGEKEDGLALMESKIVAGKTMIYVCENKTCQRPVENVADALMQVKP